MERGKQTACQKGLDNIVTTAPTGYCFNVFLVLPLACTGVCASVAPATTSLCVHQSSTRDHMLELLNVIREAQFQHFAVV